MTRDETPGDAIKSIFTGGIEEQNEAWREDLKRKRDKMEKQADDGDHQ